MQKKTESFNLGRPFAQKKNASHKYQASLKLLSPQAAIIRPHRIKKVPMAQKMQMIKLQQQKASTNKDKIPNSQNNNVPTELRITQVIK